LPIRRAVSETMNLAGSSLHAAPLQELNVIDVIFPDVMDDWWPSAERRPRGSPCAPSWIMICAATDDWRESHIIGEVLGGRKAMDITQLAYQGDGCEAANSG
jgi:hypothetical protein